MEEIAKLKINDHSYRLIMLYLTCENNGMLKQLIGMVSDVKAANSGQQQEPLKKRLEEANSRNAKMRANIALAEAWKWANENKDTDLEESIFIQFP